MIGRTRCNDCIFPETESIVDKAHNEHIPRCVYGRKQAEEGISEKGWHDAHKIQNKTGTAAVTIVVLGLLSSCWDKLIVIDAVVFLASCLLSFLAVRATGRVSERELRLERRAEIVFMLGIALLAIGAVLLAFVVT